MNIRPIKPAVNPKAALARIDELMDASENTHEEAENTTKTKGIRHTLTDLLAQCDPDAPLSDEDHEWLDAPAHGRELI
jgi:hypothetical protein